MSHPVEEDESAGGFFQDPQIPWFEHIKIALYAFKDFVSSQDVPRLVVCFAIYNVLRFICKDPSKPFNSELRELETTSKMLRISCDA